MREHAPELAVVSRPLVLIGGGGNAADVLDIIEALPLQQRWHVIGILDDGIPRGKSRYGCQVLGMIADAPCLLERYPDCQFISTIGSDKTFQRRPEIVTQLCLPLDRYATLVHPKAAVSRTARVGHGTYASAGCVVGRNAHVGNHVHLGSGCLIGHDATIEDYAVIAAGVVVSGHARIGQACYIGAGSRIRQDVHIAAGALVGLGAVVTRTLDRATVYVGCPARPRQKPEPASLAGQFRSL